MFGNCAFRGYITLGKDNIKFYAYNQLFKSGKILIYCLDKIRIIIKNLIIWLLSLTKVLPCATRAGTKCGGQNFDNKSCLNLQKFKSKN